MANTLPCPYCDAPVARDATACAACEIELPEGFWDPPPDRPVNPADAFNSQGLAPGVLDRRAQSQRAAHVSLGVTEVEGAVGKDAVIRTIHRHNDELVACYKKRLASVPGLHGSLHVAFMILPKGTVSRIEISPGTLTDPPLAQCVQSSLGRWAFPRPTNGGVARVRTVVNFQEE